MAENQIQVLYERIEELEARNQNADNAASEKFKQQEYEVNSKQS